MTAPENIYALADGYPTTKDADPHGMILYFCQKWGWILAEHDEAEDVIVALKCTHWTYTPQPPAI